MSNEHLENKGGKMVVRSHCKNIPHCLLPSHKSAGSAHCPGAHTHLNHSINLWFEQENNYGLHPCPCWMLRWHNENRDRSGLRTAGTDKIECVLRKDRQVSTRALNWQLRERQSREGVGWTGDELVMNKCWRKFSQWSMLILSQRLTRRICPSMIHNSIFFF
jgi:hypothetical protein